jgi:ABC-type transporter Mla subunit MlaD
LTIETSETLDQSKKSLEDAIKTLMNASTKISGIETHIIKAISEMKAASDNIESSQAKLSSTISRELSQADRRIEERHSVVKDILENHSESLQQLGQTINDNSNKLSESLSNEFSKADKQAEDRHNESMQTIQDNSNKLQSVAKSIEDNSNKLSESLSNEFSKADKQAEDRHNESMQSQENSLNDLKEIREGQLPGILSLLRFALVVAAIGAAASIIALLKGFL